MLIAFWIVVPSLTYLFLGGVLAPRFQRAVIKNCSRCYLSNGTTYHKMGTYNYVSKEHHSGEYWAIIWPIVIPIMLGQMLSNKESRTKARAISAKVRRDEEIAEAEHQAQLAKIRADEDAHLTRQLQDK